MPKVLIEVAPDRLEPEMVTLVPPPVGPDEGETEVTCGELGGGGVVEPPTIGTPFENVTWVSHILL